MTKEILKAAPESLAAMQRAGGSWYAYQNADLGAREFGHLKFLKCGEGCTFETPPKLPDTATVINWRYQYVGPVNMETGEIQNDDTKPVYGRRQNSGH
jgi:hypothetical protein